MSGTPLPAAPLADSQPTFVAPAREARGRLRVCMMVTYDMASSGGGVREHAVNLAAALRRRGDDVVLVGPSSTPSRDPQVRTFGGIVNIPANGSDNFLALMVSPRGIAEFFRTHVFDVIHIHEPLLPFLSPWSVWLTRDVPHVATFHAYAEREPTALRLARRTWGAAVFPWFQRAIAVSKAAARHAAAAWKGPLSIIPNGVATDVFRPLPIHATSNGNGHGHAGDGRPVRLLFVGRLGDKRKGAPILFEAYRALLERGIPVTLDVVGELGRAAPPPELSGLRYHGAVDAERLRQLYRECDVFVAPSTGQESFGIVLLEGMASGKPIVCSDIDGYRQVAPKEGALLVPPRDVRALHDALAHVVEMGPEQRRAWGANNRRASEQYDWDRLVDAVRGEYHAAIGALRGQA